MKFSLVDIGKLSQRKKEKKQAKCIYKYIRQLFTHQLSPRRVDGPLVYLSKCSSPLFLASLAIWVICSNPERSSRPVVEEQPHSSSVILSTYRFVRVFCRAHAHSPTTYGLATTNWHLEAS